MVEANSGTDTASAWERGGAVLNFQTSIGIGMGMRSKEGCAIGKGVLGRIGEVSTCEDGVDLIHVPRLYFYFSFRGRCRKNGSIPSRAYESEF